MPTNEELVKIVLGTIQESSFTKTEVIRLFNDCLEKVSLEVLLPDLETSGTFDTDPLTNSVIIPVAWNYSRNMYDASVGSVPIKTLTSVGILKNIRPNIDSVLDAGNLRFITTQKGNLIYSSSPSEVVTVSCKFYEKPTPLVSQFDIPTCIPLPYQEQLFTNYALWKLYNQKEDGMEGLKTNTLYHKGLYTEALEAMGLSFKSGQSQVDPHRETSWI